MRRRDGGPTVGRLHLHTFVGRLDRLLLLAGRVWHVEMNEALRRRMLGWY